MPLKRKTRNLPHANDKQTNNQMSFFDPVYPNNDLPNNVDGSDSETSNEVSRRPTSRDANQDESNETLDALTNNNPPVDEEISTEISTAKIVDRIRQIQHSMEQAQTMLESMEQFKTFVPGSNEQCEKLRIIIANLAEQQEGYVNLLNLITLTNKERSAVMEKMLHNQPQFASNGNDQSNDDDDEDEDDEEVEERNQRSIRHHNQSPVRPRIESKMGFTPQPPIAGTPTVSNNLHSWDIEPSNRHDNSNYDSLVGSLKSDTINWKDQQSTSGDEASDVENENENEKEMEKNLMLQKEQLRALQGQKRALLALKRRSEQRLLEQQQLLKKQTTDSKENLSESDLLGGINHLRDRLKLLRSLYEEKHQNEMQQIKTTPKKVTLPNENRLVNLQHVRERLDELEEIVNFYQFDVMNQQEEETTVYEETPIQPDDVQRLRSLMIQQQQQQQRSTITSQPQTEHTPQQLDQLSNELAAKRLELEQAKSALSRLQEMVEKIEPDQPPPNTANKKKSNETQLSVSQQTPQSNAKGKGSLLSSILSPKPVEQQKSSTTATTTNTYADVQMAAQHREIERLLESRQRLHTIKDQIASLHQSMTTPTATATLPTKKDSSNGTPINKRTNTRPTESSKPMYRDPKNDSKSRSPTYRLKRETNDDDDDDDDDDEDEDLYRFECESGDGEEIDDDTDQEMPSRMKQGNFRAPEDIVAENEQHLLNPPVTSSTDLTVQMKEICHCLSTFIQEQKSFNRHIEEHITTNRSASASASVNTDPVFNQFQQQVLTQGLIVNLNSAYREIAILQSEVNALQTENTRLTSSLSSTDRAQFYSRENSKESIYSLDQMKNVRPQARSRFDEHIKAQNHRSTTTATNKFENSSKTSFNSQSTGQQTAIHVTKPNIETTPIKHERNTTFSSGRLSSPKPSHLRSIGLSNSYEITSNTHQRSSKENLSKSFVIRRRPLSSDQDTNVMQTQLFKYSQPATMETYSKYQKNTYADEEEDDDDDDDDDDDSTSEKEQQTKDLSTTISNIRPSAYYTSNTHDLDQIDIQTLELQIKSIMVQMIPFMRLHINDIFNQSILNHIRERILFLFKQQPDSASLVRHFQNQFSESLSKTLEKYSGTTIRNGAGDLIRDMSDVAFDELVKYKVVETNNSLLTIQSDEPSIKQNEDYSPAYDSSIPHYGQQSVSLDDGDNETKYQIELAESENRPINLIGSDEEDNDSDQEENKDSELETAVSRQETNHQLHENPINSNGHEYVLVNRSTSQDVVQEVLSEQQPKDNENEQLNESN